MRTIGLSVACFLLASITLAQQPKSAQPVTLNPVLDPKNSRLDLHLTNWEQRMSSVESILCGNIRREEKDKASGFTKVFEGEARYLKPNYAALRIIQVDNPKNFELYVATGQYLYNYRPVQKEILIYDQEGGKLQNNFLLFLFGMNATEVKQKYELTLSKDISAENPHYVYIEIKPKLDADKRQFTRAQLVLFSQTMLPRRLWFEHPNGDQVTWDIPKIDTTTKMKPADFSPPPAPEGWRTTKVPRMDSPVQPASNPGAPRIVRPGSDK